MASAKALRRELYLSSREGQERRSEGTGGWEQPRRCFVRNYRDFNFYAECRWGTSAGCWTEEPSKCSSRITLTLVLC